MIKPQVELTSWFISLRGSKGERSGTVWCLKKDFMTSTSTTTTTENVLKVIDFNKTQFEIPRQTYKMVQLGYNHVMVMEAESDVTVFGVCLGGATKIKWITKWKSVCILHMLMSIFGILLQAILTKMCLRDTHSSTSTHRWCWTLLDQFLKSFYLFLQISNWILFSPYLPVQLHELWIREWNTILW